jgi:hypothetical protein
VTTPEGKVKAKVKARLIAKLKRCYAFWSVQTGLGASTLDCLLCVNGYFVAIETKAAGKELTPRQEIVQKQIEDAGGLVYVINEHTDLDMLLLDIAVAACQ